MSSQCPQVETCDARKKHAIFCRLFIVALRTCRRRQRQLTWKLTTSQKRHWQVGERVVCDKSFHANLNWPSVCNNRHPSLRNKPCTSLLLLNPVKASLLLATTRNVSVHAHYHKNSHIPIGTILRLFSPKTNPALSRLVRNKGPNVTWSSC